MRRRTRFVGGPVIVLVGVDSRDHVLIVHRGDSTLVQRVQGVPWPRR